MQYPATQMRRPLRVLKSKIHIMIVTYSIPKHRPLQLLPKHYGLSQLGRAPCALRPWGCLQEDITGMNHPKSLMHKISHSPHPLTNLTPCHSHSSVQRSISQTTLQPINQSTEYDFGGLQPDRDRRTDGQRHPSDKHKSISTDILTHSLKRYETLHYTHRHTHKRMCARMHPHTHTHS